MRENGSERFVPYSKLSKKRRREIDALSRKDWGGVRPVTIREPDAKKYCRRQKHKNSEEY